MGGGSRNASAFRSRTTSVKRDETVCGYEYVAARVITALPAPAPTMHALRQSLQQLRSSVLGH